MFDFRIIIRGSSPVALVCLEPSIVAAYLLVGIVISKVSCAGARVLRVVCCYFLDCRALRAWPSSKSLTTIGRYRLYIDTKE